MDVRLARPTDAPLVLALALDERSHLIGRSGWPGGPGATGTVARSLLPVVVPGRAWVARGTTGSALLEAESRRYVIGWDITRLVVRGDPDELLGPILGAATSHVQRQGVPRLFARCNQDAADVLVPYEFQLLAREYVLMRPAGPTDPERPLPIDSRYRMPQDAWPLHQLETQVSPPLVRQLEGLTSLDWSHSPKEMREIVVERHGQVAAWIGWGARIGSQYRQIDLLLHPDHADVGPDLLSHVLGQAAGGQRYVARVREYQVETLQAFIESGFEVVAEEVVLVKHAGAEMVQRANRLLKLAQMAGVPAMPHQARIAAGPGVASTVASILMREESQ